MLYCFTCGSHLTDPVYGKTPPGPLTAMYYYSILNTVASLDLTDTTLD